MGTVDKHLRTLKLVLVDDDPTFTLMWSRIWQAQGHQVARCHDLQSACRGIAEGCDCVITDMRMRGFTGIDLIRAANHPAGPVMILLTAEDAVRVAEEAIGAGAACVFRKGADTSLVVSTVEALCGAVYQPVMRYGTGEFSVRALRA
jgi:DNA-binding NtrC family response regulator